MLEKGKVKEVVKPKRRGWTATVQLPWQWKEKSTAAEMNMEMKR